MAVPAPAWTAWEYDDSTTMVMIAVMVAISAMPAAAMSTAVVIAVVVATPVSTAAMTSTAGSAMVMSHAAAVTSAVRIFKSQFF